MEDSQQEKVFYQDSKVSVTLSRYIAANKTYAMRNISSVSIFKMSQSRTMPILLLVFGIILVITEVYSFGVTLALIGGIWLFTIKDKFSVRISTNAGEANSIVSSDKIYIQKIVDALNEAIIQRG